MPNRTVRLISRLISWSVLAFLLFTAAGCAQSATTERPPASAAATGPNQGQAGDAGPTSLEEPGPASPEPAGGGASSPAGADLISVEAFLQANKGIIAFVSQGLLDWASGLKELGILPISLDGSPLEHATPPAIHIDPALTPPRDERHLRVVATRVTTLGAYITRIHLHPDSIDVVIVPQDGTFHDIEIDLNRYKNGQRVPVRFIVTGPYQEFVVEKVPARE
ncbi:hypothetical protein [Thermaerobacter subterraneus]|uniref:Uncharacterized protein n=1 Tax=Thermaerobacter subterraneus DSM 13965 TaxID=867903 RepID=K6QED9_9FIRM|nr:hypothetical protein [Thermaerobacter subterraneus]EKP95186.1 hypothetical protein ThesuDRAFT_00925 [Thermaerobacter subterraneus DSM 13965]